MRADGRAGDGRAAVVRVTVMHDYQCEVLWVERDDVREPEDPHEHGLSPSLCGRLEAWRHWGESRLNLADPYDSREVDEVEDRAFHEEGRLLAARVAQEMGDRVPVSYWKDTTGAFVRPTQEPT